MNKPVTLFVAGVITIGVITALVLPGRKSAELVKAGGQAGQGLLGTAITGKS